MVWPAKSGEVAAKSRFTFEGAQSSMGSRRVCPLLSFLLDFLYGLGSCCATTYSWISHAHLSSCWDESRDFMIFLSIFLGWTIVQPVGLMCRPPRILRLMQLISN
jgi:hypothetical protein